jgi:hypothetical protein
MTKVGALALLFLFACSGSSGTTDQPLNPGSDGGSGPKPAGAACTQGAECAGGTCLGAPGQPQEGNETFAGGYCTAVGCTPESQNGCGPDEWCIDGGGELRGFCVEMCSRAEGLTCDRGDHVCLGIGSFGGCFSEEAVECDRVARTGCKPSEICVKIGFEEASPLGRCETVCDPMNDICEGNTACYFIRAYSAPFCGTPGTVAIGGSCTCDKCCEPGLACTPDLDGAGRHCKELCEVDTTSGCGAGERCQPLKVGSPWGGCTKE